MKVDAISKPTEEPISLELAWAHLRIDADGSPLSSPDDLWLEKIGIPGARGIAENFTGRSFAQKTYRLMLDEFPDGAIPLEMPPIESITAVEYVDADGVTQTMPNTDYYLDSRHRDSWLLPAHGTSWPAALVAPNAVTVTYVAGYAAADVPEEAMQAILLLLGHSYRNREAVSDKQSFEMPIGIEYILRPLRIKLGMA